MTTGRNSLGKEQPRNRTNLNPISRLFENPQNSIEPYVRKGQMVADLGCNTGFYTFALAEYVGPEGRVYAVDLKEEYVEALEKKGDELGYHNIVWHAASASDLSFIKDESADFVLANGLLCNVPDHRQRALFRGPLFQRGIRLDEVNLFSDFRRQEALTPSPRPRPREKNPTKNRTSINFRVGSN
jgi:SAM-dependent methyltransferase